MATSSGIGGLPTGFNILGLLRDPDNDFNALIDPFTDQTKKIIGTTIPYLNASGGKNLINPSVIGLGTFQNMIERDGVIATCIDYHAATMVESLGKYMHPNNEVQNFIRYMLENLNKGFQDLINKMITAYWAGFAIIEKYQDYDEYVKADIVKDVYLLPPLTFLFQANNDGRTSGIFQYVINAVTPAYSNLLTYNTNVYENDPYSDKGNFYIPIRTMTVNPVGLVEIDQDRVIHFVYTGLTGLENPYGVSILNRVYDLFLLKYGLLQSMATAFARRAVPYTVVYANSQQMLSERDAFGTVVRKVNPVTAAANAFRNPFSTDVFIMPGKKGEFFEVDVVDSDGDLKVFVEAIQEINVQIMRALKVPETTFNAKGGGYALGSEQGSVFRTFADVERDQLQQVLIRQFIKPILDQNFTPEELAHQDNVENVEDDTMGQSEREDHYPTYGRFAQRVMSPDDMLKFAEIFLKLKEGNLVNFKVDANQIRSIFNLSALQVAQLQEMADQAAMQDKPPLTDGNNMDKVKRDNVGPYATARMQGLFAA